eukprot:TRINITY_DN10209_c0_g1_i2.p1 TRINITY_DN10209_c0_g1~~TRINITY_DN10209_c0_g1_i2.p1  ORF type:complete len:114 (+),score=20.44 TRINITY_DN10209_c0_g1_i2:108-449(+)
MFLSETTLEPSQSRLWVHSTAIEASQPLALTFITPLVGVLSLCFGLLASVLTHFESVGAQVTLMRLISLYFAGVVFLVVANRAFFLPLPFFCIVALFSSSAAVTLAATDTDVY